MPETAATRRGRAGGGPLSALPAVGADRAFPAPTSLEVLRHLGSGPRGLVESHAEERLARHGENTLPQWRTPSWPRRLLRGLRDPFTAVLLCLGLVSAAVTSWQTACVILCLVLVSCVLRSAGEHRADRALAALRDLVPSTATVLRRADGDEKGPPRPREVPVALLVPGDVLRLGPGDLVPADVRLLRSGGLTVHQAALTGESGPVDKRPVDVSPFGRGEQAADAASFDRSELCFQGSSVVSGSATAVVLATGADTRFAAAHGDRGRREPSAFDRSVQGISWILVRFMLLTPPLVLTAGAVVRGRGWEALPFAVAVAVGLTPEMLPVVVTTCLARGAALLARRHKVFVKRLPALHDLGAIDVLCLDKTGTLTQDLPVLHAAWDARGGPDPKVLHWAATNAWWTLHLAELPAPDALDEALLGDADAEELARHDGVAALPFDPVRRIATAVVRRPDRLGTDTLVVKGAVEAVVQRCTLDDAERARVLAFAARQSDAGLRLLAVATSARPARRRGYTPADEHGLDFRGFVALRDAPDPTAAEALRVLARRGVDVKVLTGDHPGTATRVCHDLGLEPGTVLTAAQVDALGDTALADAARDTTVFARCTPAHKTRIVRALRAGGRNTGFLGDGVNDLPALRAADVGICPGEAVDIARESADVVLAEKDLAAIDHAIDAGRRSSGNISSYLQTTLSSNLGNVIAMLAAGVLLPFLPMLPVQVLAQNLCFDAAQLAFAFDRPAPAVLGGPVGLRPRAFLRFISGFGVLNATADLATFGVLALFAPHADGREAAFHSGWFTENLLTQAMVMLLLRTGRLAAEGRPARPVLWAAAALSAIGVLVPLSPLGPALGMLPMPPVYHLLLVCVLALYALGLVAARRRCEGGGAGPSRPQAVRRGGSLRD